MAKPKNRPVSSHFRPTRLAESGRVDLRSLISHRFPLKKAAEAFKLNAAYAAEVVKVMIKS